MKKSNLDEMQEQALLKIEHNGCWLAFWGLLAAMALQMVMRVPGRQMLGEWIVFMALSLYIVIACLRKGIWDRHLKANRKTNLIVSLLAAVATGILVTLSNPYLPNRWTMYLLQALPADSPLCSALQPCRYAQSSTVTAETSWTKNDYCRRWFQRRQ